MIEAMKWTSFTILYEDSEGLVRLQEVLKMSTSKKDIKITVRQLIPDPGGDYRYTLFSLSYLQSDIFVSIISWKSHFNNKLFIILLTGPY